MSLKAIKTLDYTVIPCRDLAAMRAFYTDVLGLPIAYERHDWIKFQLGQVALALRPRSAPFFESGRDVDRPSVQLAFLVDDDQVDTCHQELTALGIPILEPPTDQPWGHRTLYFADPEGNVLELYADVGLSPLTAFTHDHPRSRS